MPATEEGIRRAHNKLTAKIENYQNHTANFLVSQYDLNIMPEFMTAGMSAKRRRRFEFPKPEFYSDEKWTKLQKVTKTPGFTLKK